MNNLEKKSYEAICEVRKIFCVYGKLEEFSPFVYDILESELGMNTNEFYISKYIARRLSYIVPPDRECFLGIQERLDKKYGNEINRDKIFNI